MAVAGSTVVVAWIERGADHRWRLYFRRSTDAGRTWGSRALMSDTGQALTVSMASHGSRIDMVWNLGLADGSASQIWYARSTNAGASWTKQALTTGADEAGAPTVARDASGTVAVVWAGGPTSPATVWARVSTSGGTNFGPRRALTQTQDSTTYPRVAIGLYGKIHVVYGDGLIPGGGAWTWYQRSSDRGRTWTAPQAIAAHTEDIPTIAAQGRTVIVGFMRMLDGSERWIKYRRSLDNGAHWEPARELATREGLNTVLPVITVRNGHWRALFTRCLVPTCWDSSVHLRTSIDGGLTWSSPRLVSPDVHLGNRPIAADGGSYTVVAWARNGPADPDFPDDILARRSD